MGLTWCQPCSLFGLRRCACFRPPSVVYAVGQSCLRMFAQQSQLKLQATSIAARHVAGQVRIFLTPVCASRIGSFWVAMRCMRAHQPINLFGVFSLKPWRVCFFTRQARKWPTCLRFPDTACELARKRTSCESASEAVPAQRHGATGTLRKGPVVAPFAAGCRSIAR